MAFIHSLWRISVLCTLCITLGAVNASLFRRELPKISLTWVLDPHATAPCTEPMCINHTKEGFNVVPMNISVDVNTVIQVAERPAKRAAVLRLDILTQPGCFVTACRMTTVLNLIPKEDCFKDAVERQANQPDGVSALIKFGGVYYEKIPEGELYIKFERYNYLTQSSTCTYQVLGGFKRWF